MAEHTPGPWQVSGTRHSGDLKIGRDTRLHAVGPDGDALAMVFFDMKTGRGFADARLIAAAPDMHAAIKQFMPKGIEIGNGNVPDDLTIPMDVTMGELRAFDAALAKAEGL